MQIVKRIVFAASLVGLAALTLPATISAQRSGVEIWSQTCGNCHTIQPTTRYTAGQWASIMSHMALASRLTDAESEAVLEFLKGGAKPLASADLRGQESEVIATVASGNTVGPVALVHVPSVDSTKLYQQQCVACHGKEGKGDGPAAVAFDPKPTSFADSAFQASRTDEQLFEAVSEGKQAMPGFSAQLKPEQIRAMVAYIRMLGGQPDQ